MTESYMVLSQVAYLGAIDHCSRHGLGAFLFLNTLYLLKFD